MLTFQLQPASHHQPGTLMVGMQSVPLRVPAAGRDHADSLVGRAHGHIILWPLVLRLHSHQQIDVSSFQQRLQLALRVCCKIRLAMMPQTASAVRDQPPVRCRH